MIESRAMEFDGQKVIVGDEPPTRGGDSGKWYWLRRAIANVPVGQWVSFMQPNEREARRAQSSINNKYVKDAVHARGLKIRTRITPAPPGNDGQWKVYFMLYSE